MAGLVGLLIGWFAVASRTEASLGPLCSKGFLDLSYHSRTRDSLGTVA